MITPLEVQTKEFPKALRGYNESEVDEFLNEVMVTLENYINEKEELREKVTRLEKENKRYSQIEKTLSDTLVVAKKTADDVAKNADEKARVIIKSAEEEAKRKIHDSNQEVLRIRSQYEEGKKDLIIFKTRFKTLIQAQLELMEKETLD